MATFKPTEETSALYARYKRAKETEEQLRLVVKELAIADMRDRDASIGELARLTGMTDEVFRRLARENGIERKREPTVGRDAKPRPAAD